MQPTEAGLCEYCEGRIQMTARKVLRSACLCFSMAVLVGAMTGCPVFLGPGAAGSASISATPPSGPAPLAVQFHGNVTAAPPYEVESWTWDFGDGAAGNGKNVAHTYAAAGTYTAKLKVALVAPKFRGEDDYPPVTLEDSRVIRVLAVVENLPPIADAGPDQTLFLGPGVALDGSGSSDPDGDPITYAWTFDSRPAGSAAVLAGATTVNPTFTPDLKGVYVLRLIVNDGALDSAPDTMTVTVPNRPPVANAGPDQNVLMDTALSVPLDGSASYDPDGDPLSYNWSLVSVPEGSSPTLNAANMVTSYLAPDVAGIYVLQLEVHDGTVMSAPDTVQVTVSLRNRPPVANAGPDQNVFLGETVLHDGSGSSDPDGNPLTYAWSIVSAPAGSTAALMNPTTVNPTFLPDRKGPYEIQLIVNDGLENSAPDTMLVIVGNRPPVANAGADREADNSELVTLDGSASSDPDGDPLTYAWSFVSVPTGSAAVLANATSANPSFTTDLGGSYVVQLIVNDGTVDSAPDTVVISVAQQPPTAVGNVVINENLVPEADVSADTDNPDLAINLDTLYGIPRWTAFLGEPTKQYQDPIQLIRLDPDTAEVLGAVPIYLVVEQEVAPGWTVLRHVVANAAKGLAVDHATGELWAILGFGLGYEVKQYETYWCLARVNPYTGVAVPNVQPFVQSLPELYSGIAFDDIEGLYGVTGNRSDEKAVDTTHALYGINRTTELETFLIQVPEPPDVNRTPGEAIAFNTDDGWLYHASGSFDGSAARLFASFNMYTVALANFDTSTTQEVYWRRPTAMTYAPGTGIFYLAEMIGEGDTAIHRVSTSGSVMTETFVGEPDLYTPIKGLAFLYDRSFAPPLVTLDATGSSDPDLDPLTYQWSFASVPAESELTNADLSTPTAITTSFTPDVKGTYVIQIVVNDGTSDSAPATATVHYVNTPPVANAGVNQTYPQGYGEAKLNAGDSYDPDGTALDFEWRFVSVPAGSTLENFSLYPGQDCPAPFFYPDVASETEPYVLEVTVTDSEGATDTDQVEVLAVIVN